MMDDSCGEIPVAFVVACGGSDITEDEVKQYVAKQVRQVNDSCKDTLKTSSGESNSVYF